MVQPVQVGQRCGIAKRGAGLVGVDVFNHRLDLQHVAFSINIVIGINHVAQAHAYRGDGGHSGDEIGAIGERNIGVGCGGVYAARISRRLQAGVEHPLDLAAARHIGQVSGQGIDQGHVARGAGRQIQLDFIGEHFAD